MNQKEKTPGILQDFAGTFMAAATLPPFKAAAVAVVLGLGALLVGMFVARGQIKILVSMAGMFVSYAGFEKMGKLIQAIQQSSADQESGKETERTDKHVYHEE